MKTINEKELKELGINNIPEYLSQLFSEVLKEDQALVCVIDNNRTNGLGYLIGVATKNLKGHIPTFYVLEEHNYTIASNWVDETNCLIFKRNRKETMKIVLSTMF
jgi:hypothetical protein